MHLCQFLKENKNMFNLQVYLLCMVMESIRWITDIAVIYMTDSVILIYKVLLGVIGETPETMCIYFIFDNTW